MEFNSVGKDLDRTFSNGTILYIEMYQATEGHKIHFIPVRFVSALQS